MRNPFRKEVTPQPDPLENWRIEAMDITGRWDAIDEHELRAGMNVKGVLVHPWNTEEGLSYEQIIPLLKGVLDHGVLDRSKYHNRPLRIANIKTGDFMPFEILGIKVERVTDPKVESSDEFKKMLRRAQDAKKKMKSDIEEDYHGEVLPGGPTWVPPTHPGGVIPYDHRHPRKKVSY